MKVSRMGEGMEVGERRRNPSMMMRGRRLVGGLLFFWGEEEVEEEEAWTDVSSELMTDLLIPPLCLPSCSSLLGGDGSKLSLPVTCLITSFTFSWPVFNLVSTVRRVGRSRLAALSQSRVPEGVLGSWDSGR